jgi:hypothetical protein
MPQFESLHNARPDVDISDSFDWGDLDRVTNSAGVRAHFGDLTDAAIRFIEASDSIVGCVAWLTEPRILAALVDRQASIIVQKEDFLRPDVGMPNQWKARLRSSYDQIGNDYTRYEFPAPLSSASTLSGQEIEGVRCVGNHNSDRAPAMPRMHHKFLVRLQRNVEQGDDQFGGHYSSYAQARALAVWTGSFNFSINGGRSFENAIEIDDPTIAGAYLAEYARVATLSEPLNWTADWVDAEWRLGT